MTWDFYGRREQLDQLSEILARGRWFFIKVTGRRRIGKTTLIHQALEASGNDQVFYLQIPDSAPAGVLSAFQDAFETFAMDTEQFPLPRSLGEMAATVGALARSGYVVVLDEFQYFHRERLNSFCSLLQHQVDELARDSANVPGGLLVLGSIHTELTSLLEDRDAPLYGRTTHEIALDHLDIQTVVEILQTHEVLSAKRLLFLWGLFEGVPKFYRDCYEEDLLRASRSELLEGIFFKSSSPLRSEAENWFLKELRGRYDVILKFLARSQGARHAEIVDYVRQVSRDTKEQVAGYLQILIGRYGLIEKRQPIFGNPRGTKGRYYITDNFLAAWLAALKTSVSSRNFRPVATLVAATDERLQAHEGRVLEKLVKVIYEERSRKGVGDFFLTEAVNGFWNRGDPDVDLIFVDEEQERIRFGTCKRNPERLLGSLTKLDEGIQIFLKTHRRFQGWTHERVAIAPFIPDPVRQQLEGAGVIAEGLPRLLGPLGWPDQGA
jgi:AAA+ ATPase superfamily predicted ATPase